MKNKAANTLQQILIMVILPCFSFAQAFVVSYTPATKLVNGELRLNYEASGQSVHKVSSKEMLLYFPQGMGNPPSRTWQDEFEAKATATVNDFFGKMGTFDYNNLGAAKNVYTMQKDSASASKIPKTLQLYKKSVSQYKLLEPLSDEVHNYFQTVDKIYLTEMKKIADGYLARQKIPLSNGDANFRQAQSIVKFSGEFANIVRTSRTDFGTQTKFSSDQNGQIAKLKSDISFAQNQIKKIMGNKTSLDQLTANARSEVTQLAGVVALALKQTATIVSTYLEAISGYPITNGSIDVIRTFIESSIEEGVVNDRPLKQAFQTAFQMAYTKAILHVSSSHEFPLADLATLPLKIKGMIDDKKIWDELLNYPDKLRKEVNNQFRQMDNAILLNERIIKKSQEQIDILLKKESKKFLNTPYKE